MYGSAQPDSPFPVDKTGEGIAPTDPASSTDNSTAGQTLGEHELEAALQLLVERAQYITGATGAALALPSGDEMVCRASAGTSAPPVGARLQVRSGLTGESIARRQLLRCDNAENDPRVNLETCREMGIASIVVLPLLRPNGDIRGLFELFSDHAYAFEERDLSALERMADLTLTALDLAEGRPSAVADFVHAGVAPQRRTDGPGASSIAAAASMEQQQGQKVEPELDKGPVPAVVQADKLAPTEPIVPELVTAEVQEDISIAAPTPLPEAMRRVPKCAICGFPVSEGRTYCLDCERKAGKPSPAPEPEAAQPVPAFLNISAPPDESWLGNHVNLLAIVVLILGILVAIVVFR
jgi:putative methionine-R-sulfoxide reductase with GAF domain